MKSTMMIKAWKVLRKDKNGRFLSSSIYEEDGGVEYKESIITKPVENKGPLCAFTCRKSAEVFADLMSPNSYISECEVVKSEETVIWTNPLRKFSIQQLNNRYISNFVLCDSIKLLERPKLFIESEI